MFQYFARVFGSGVLKTRDKRKEEEEACSVAPENQKKEILYANIKQNKESYNFPESIMIFKSLSDVTCRLI